MGLSWNYLAMDLCLSLIFCLIQENNKMYVDKSQNFLMGVEILECYCLM